VLALSLGGGETAVKREENYCSPPNVPGDLLSTPPTLLQPSFPPRTTTTQNSGLHPSLEGRGRGGCKVCGAKASEPVACGCLVLKAMAATEERIRKLSRTYHEQIMNRLILRLVHTPKLTVY